jgi:hypothetical protein
MTASEGRTAVHVSPRRRRGGRTARLAWVVAGLGLASVAVLGWVHLQDRQATTAIETVSRIALLVSLAAFILSGAVIVSRQPGNVIGWLLMIPGLTASLSELALRWLAGVTPPPTEVNPPLWLLLWATGIAWVALIFPIFHVLLTLPTGRLLSPRWRAAVVLELVMISVMALLAAFSADMGPLVNDVAVWRVPNPIGFVPGDDMDGAFGTLWTLGLVTLSALGASAVVLRFRRGTRDERQQLKWPLLGGLVFGITYAGTAVQSGVVGPLFALGIAAMPISIAIAITRYRLYDIDRLISRTVGWAIVTGILLAVFAVPVIGLQAVVNDVTQGQTVVVAASTLLAAALFQPVRGGVQRAVDRRFDRARYDGERVVARFGERLREHVDLDTLSSEVRHVADDTVRPTTSGIWLRGATKATSGPSS